MVARIEAQRQNFPKALEALDAIVADGRMDDVPIGTHYLRGDVFARMDRAADAERELQEEIRLNPGQIEGRSGLALVYASSERMGDAKRVIAEMVVKVGNADAYARAVRALTFFQDRPAAEALRREGRRRFPFDPRLKKGV
jgi:predicted Zn-dependent protease